MQLLKPRILYRRYWRVLLDNLTVEELQVKLQETRADLATNMI